MAAKYFLIYYHKGARTFVVTEPRPSRENQDHFPNFTFQTDNHPTPLEIEKWLIDNWNFQKVVQNLDPNLIL